MNYLHPLREYLTPVMQKGNLEKTGMLTPDEFVASGDYLVAKCPTWQWRSGEPSKRKNYLPDDKQYLMTRNVANMVSPWEEASPQVKGEWTVYEIVKEEIPEICIDKRDNNDDVDDVDDIDDAIDDDDAPEPDYHGLEKSDEKEKLIDEEVFSTNFELCSINEDDDEDPAAIKSNIVKTRTYDIYITYDNWYRTPRVWLFGQDERKNPLTKKQMFADISSEHAEKTVTHELHPHENFMTLSIHPCEHASVMKKRLHSLVNGSKSADKPTDKSVKKSQGKISLHADSSVKSVVKPEQYMFIFLKFISTIIPNVAYDYSVAI